MSIANEIQRLQSAKANIKSAIEQKGVTVGDGNIDTYAEKIGEISAGGGDLDYMKYAQAIKFKNLNLFGTSEVSLNFDELSDLREMFFANHNDNQWKQNVTVEHITISTKAKVMDMYRMFSSSTAYMPDTTLKHITLNFELDVENQALVGLNNAFQNAKGLEVIDGIPLNLSNTTSFNSTFMYCEELREIRFVENSIKASISFSHSNKLSDATIQSIIEGLADLTGSTTQTLTFHKTVGGKLTDTQKATITAKNWTLAY